MIWGFSDRAIAETLKTLALSIGKGPNAVPDPLRDNGSRIFVVSLPEALDPLSKNGGTDLTPSSGTAKLFKKDLSTDALALRKSGNSEEDYTVPIFNLSGHSIPETPEEPKPEDLHLAIQDSFGALYLLPEVSELFGTLAESWEPGDTEAKTITLDEGFERSEDFAPFQAFPAPTLSEGLSTGTAVTCRYVKAVGKWFFFRPSGREKPCHRIVTCSGDALNAFGTADDGLEIWATQLAAAPTPNDVGSLTITAVYTEKQAYGSDDDTPWIDFPTLMITDPTGNQPNTDIKYVRGNFYMEAKNGTYKIYRKEDFRDAYSLNNQTYEDTLFYFNNHPCYYNSITTNYIYYDGYEYWRYGSLGDLYNDTNRIGQQYQQTVPATPIVKTYWECNSEFGVYQLHLEDTGDNTLPQTILLGVPKWTSTRNTVPAGDTLTVYGSMPIFARSIRHDNDNHWVYRGVLTLQNSVSGRKFVYSNITCQDGTWIFGNKDNGSIGWYSLSGEPNVSSTTTATFQVVSKPNKTELITSLLICEEGLSFQLSDIETTTEGQNVLYFIQDTEVARWTANSTTLNADITFTFEKPEDSEEDDQEDLVFTLKDFIDNDCAIPDTAFPEVWEGSKTIQLWQDSNEEEFLIVGSDTDTKGYWTLKIEDFTNTLTLTHGPVPRASLTLTFQEYGSLEEDKEPIWYISPEIIT